MATVKSLKADVSSVRPSSERLGNGKLERLDNDKWSEGNFVCLVNIPDIINLFLPNGYQIVMSEFRLSLSYELYVFSPEWRCRTHKLLIKAHFRPIFDTMHNLLRLKYTSIRISEVFQISWIPSLFSM